MHLQRVQVPDFRVLKDVDITFEHDFNPRVFPLGSQNGGGKSTLLQLIFILLHCSTNPERLPALKNLLSEFHLREGEDKRVLAIIDIWDGEKVVKLEFFICGDTYTHQIFDYADGFKTEDKLSFSTIIKLEDIQQQISRFSNKERELDDILHQLEYRLSVTGTSSSFPDDLKKQLSNLGVNFEDVNANFVDLASLNVISKEAKLQLSNQHQDKRLMEETYYFYVEGMIRYLKSANIEYITVDSSNGEALLCCINNISMDIAGQFLTKLSSKVFLAAPSTQIFLFLSKSSKKSLLTNCNDYYADLTRMNSNLSGLVTYDFLAVKIIIDAIQRAGQLDFEVARSTGEYGNNYKKLLKDLNFLLHDKQINITSDLSGLTFTKDESGDKVELETEDLSHGELKRLSTYIWLKYKNIEDAIVLMDEVDLALHPDWQYKIVSDLVDWEPSNQYILATHSYELCNALTPSHVKILEPKLTGRRSE